MQGQITAFAASPSGDFVAVFSDQGWLDVFDRNFEEHVGIWEGFEVDHGEEHGLPRAPAGLRVVRGRQRGFVLENGGAAADRPVRGLAEVHVR